MRKTIVNIICLFLFTTGVWQCTPSEYNLVDYKEIRWVHSFNQDIVDRNIRYTYKNGVPVSKTDVRWSLKERWDSTCTEYEIRRYDDRIDTIETSWDYLHDTLNYTQKTIKTYSLDGVIKKKVYYALSDTGWVEGGFTAYNASGQRRKVVNYGMSDYLYSYDSLGQYLGYRYRYLGTDSYLSIDTVIFSNDRSSAVETTTQWYDGKSIPRTTSKTFYKLDKQGRIVQKESVDPDETDSIHYSRYLITAKYNRRGQLVSTTTSNMTYNETEYRISEKTEYRYRRGLKTWELNYRDGKLRRVYRYKYDFLHKLPLERTLYCENYEDLPNNLLIFIAMMTDRVGERLIWTYEKAK